MEVLEKAIIVSEYNTERGSYSHTGVDLISEVSNRKVRAVSLGRVIEVRNTMEDDYIVNENSPVSEWAGNYVILEHSKGYTSRYSHLSFNSFNLNVGDIVEGEFAEEGYSGYATGVHLDFEVKLNGNFIDPSDYALGYKELPAYIENTVKYLNLSDLADTWRVYPMNVAPVVGNECKTLLPSKFNGLSYTLKGYTMENVAIINTRDFGEVQIYIGSDVSDMFTISDKPEFGLVN